jgi:hypothetical protein
MRLTVVEADCENLVARRDAGGEHDGAIQATGE